MKLTLDNIIFSLQTMGGISVYWYELLKRLSRDGSLEKHIFQCNQGKNHLLAEEITALGLPIQLETRIPPALCRYLAFTKKSSKHSLFHSSYYRIAHDAKNILTIHDFTYEHYRTGPARWIHTAQKARAIKHAAGIICISENTRKDLYHFFPDINIPVRVIHNGRSESFYKLPSNHQYSEKIQSFSKLKYVLFIGARAGYKNFNALVAALLDYPALHLLIVGSELTQEEKSFLNLKLPGRYIELGFVKERQLNELYNQAYCFIYPSEYEGFGIPVIEAMAAGCPVIAINKSSIPEVSGDAGLLCQQLTSAAISDFITMLDDPGQRQAIVTRGLAQAQKFSWDKCYGQTVDFYKKIDQLA